MSLDDLYVEMYNRNFRLQGNVNILTQSPPLRYILDRLRVITQCTDVSQPVLSCFRNSTDENMLDILFKAVAGEYTVGKGAIPQSLCRITADPITGYLSIVDQTQENRMILTIIIIILFVVLGWLLYNPKLNIPTTNVVPPAKH